MLCLHLCLPLSESARHIVGLQVVLMMVMPHMSSFTLSSAQARLFAFIIILKPPNNLVIEVQFGQIRKPRIECVKGLDQKLVKDETRIGTQISVS